jgi:hypothetical protein
MQDRRGVQPNVTGFGDARSAATCADDAFNLADWHTAQAV